ncbi:globin domain-containing protein [Streptomyces sp. NPDC053560]|uniref:globin domain-containing protein n=1 Tax=Streptomyces sp. NPDC053560 TaxID=3365711 RepID=UPI0037D451F2
MDAPTTASAGNGADGDSGAWSWFTPSPAKSPERPAESPGRSGESPERPAESPAGHDPEPPPVTPAAGPAPAHTGGAHGTATLPPRRAVPPAAGPAPESALEASLRTPHPAAPEASADALLIRRTMAEIEPVADQVTSYFYALLFVRYPELRQLFPVSMDEQRDRLFKALLTAAQRVDDAASLTEFLAHLGRGHRKYGTQPEHYPAVGECLLGALARHATFSWDDQAEAAWIRAYTKISQTMIDAAAEDEATAPAWWDAEVVAHELRTSDIAVVTVRPDQPYPFLAGQYTSVETPWWPRVWRHYSFAAAPRSDGLLSFHVKAVPAGWVSGALVHRARPGDVIRLGPPGGSMTVDHTTDNGLLCLGGGTGIAPIKALVEDVAEHGRRRPMEVFYGARSDHDLYDIDTMLRLEHAHPWLSVRPVISSGPTGGALRSISGQLPDAVREYGPWGEYDAYLSGPPGMIRNGVDALVGVGVPSDRIRHDALEELVAAGE